MKQLTRFSILSGLAFSGCAFAFQPIQGWYIGLLAGVGAGPSNYTRTFVATVTPPMQAPFTEGGVATINNNIVGGGGGATVGYRLQPFRFEAEINYNYIGTRNLTFDNCVLQSPTVSTPTGICPNIANGSGLGFNGSTGVTYALVNFYYDWYPNAESDSSAFPYIGLGIGGASLKTGVNFVNDLTMMSVGGTNNFTAAAGQFILGVGYFIDDYAWIGVDYRYLTTGSINPKTQTLSGQALTGAVVDPGTTAQFVTTQSSGRYAINTIMFNINFSFDNAKLNGTNV